MYVCVYIEQSQLVGAVERRCCVVAVAAAVVPPLPPPAPPELFCVFVVRGFYNCVTVSLNVKYNSDALDMRLVLVPIN